MQVQVQVQVQKNLWAQAPRRMLVLVQEQEREQGQEQKYHQPLLKQQDQLSQHHPELELGQCYFVWGHQN